MRPVENDLMKLAIYLTNLIQIFLLEIKSQPGMIDIKYTQWVSIK